MPPYYMFLLLPIWAHNKKGSPNLPAKLPAKRLKSKQRVMPECQKPTQAAWTPLMEIKQPRFAELQGFDFLFFPLAQQSQKPSSHYVLHEKGKCRMKKEWLAQSNKTIQMQGDMVAIY